MGDQANTLRKLMEGRPASGADRAAEQIWVREYGSEAESLVGRLASGLARRSVLTLCADPQQSEDRELTLWVPENPLGPSFGATPSPRAQDAELVLIHSPAGLPWPEAPGAGRCVVSIPYSFFQQEEPGLDFILTDLKACPMRSKMGVIVNSVADARQARHAFSALSLTLNENLHYLGHLQARLANRFASRFENRFLIDWSMSLAPVEDGACMDLVVKRLSEWCGCAPPDGIPETRNVRSLPVQRFHQEGEVKA